MSQLGWDYLIVGSGSAGAILAARLSEDPAARVLLLEAGPDYPDFASLPDELKYGYATASYVSTHGHLWDLVGRANRHQAYTPVPRGKVTGGTSAINGQVFLRGLRSDFDDWKALGNELWGFDDVLPSFKRLEKDLDFQDEWHGQDGPIAVRRYQDPELLPPQRAFIQACVDAGHPYTADANRPEARGISPIPFNNVGGIRASTALAYLAPVRGRSNLLIRPDSLVRRIRIAHGRALGVELADGDFLTAGEVLVAGGAIGSPHLLLASGVGPAGELEAAGVGPLHDLPGVGKHLQDHQVVDLLWYTTPEYGDAPPLSPRTQVALRYTASASRFPDDMQITPRTHTPQPRGGRADERYGVVSLVPCIERASGSGEIRLRGADPMQQPEIEFRFLEDPEDLRRLREGVRISLQLATHDEFGALLAERLAPTDEELSSDSSLDNWLVHTVRTSHHACGSCKMGPASDRMAVVDQLGRVHGLEGLRVVDASIFPEVPRANTAASTMAVAERLADLMKAARS